MNTTPCASLLSFRELLILLYKRQTGSMVLPGEITDLSADELELKKAMGELITDRYLIPGEGDKYKVSPELSEMLDIMTTASDTYVIYEETGKFSPYYMYRLNMQCVTLTVDEHHEGWIRLEKTDVDDILEELAEMIGARLIVECFRAGSTEPDRIVSETVHTDIDLAAKILEE